MTVPFRHTLHDRQPRDFATCRDDQEPRLSDLFADPTLQALMARDGVDRPALEQLVSTTRRRLDLRPPLGAQQAFEAALFAECRPLLHLEALRPDYEGTLTY